MDAIIIIILLCAVYAKSMRKVNIIQKSVEADNGIKLKTRLNPNFFKQETAFLKLHDKILDKGHPKQ